MSVNLIATYRVTLTHPDLAGPFVVDLIASTAEAAITRTRMTAFHSYRHAPLLAADCDAVYLHDGPPRDSAPLVTPLNEGETGETGISSVDDYI